MTEDTNRPDKTNVVPEENNPATRIPLIGSQRNPEAFRPAPTIPVVGDVPPSETVTYPPERAEVTDKKVTTPAKIEENVLEDDEMPDRLSEDGEKSMKKVSLPPSRAIEVPKYRGGKMSDDLEDEFNAIFGSDSLDDLIRGAETIADQDVLEPETKIKAKVISIQGDSVFLDVGAREQGVVSLKMFPSDAEPQPGQIIDVTVVRFMSDEGLYDVSVPLAAADVRDWSQVHEGMVVEAKITKTNNGGLECEVNRLRGFIPISQIEMFRVEDTEQYVGQKLVCVVEEVNVERRNLVLSRRAMLNREREEKREQLLSELEVGQTREGLVRKIIDAGAFVDLGGVDGFIPISAMSWARINHPSDVLQEGTRVKVRIAKIDTAANRISLIYRDDASNPWSNISERFQERTVARGKVTKIMDFGAFIELMPGLEGLVHISELASKRVNNVREIVKESDWVDVFIVSIDPDARRIALSIKQAAPSEPVKEAASEFVEEAPEPQRPPMKIKNEHKGPLKGGTGQSGGGEQFGLKW